MLDKLVAGFDRLEYFLLLSVIWVTSVPKKVYQAQYHITTALGILFLEQTLATEQCDSLLQIRNSRNKSRIKV